ncbi:hypothetical protein LA2_11004 (plasmid) [Lactobacillus amylovorus GRL 1112]|uniref:Treble clef zinc finger domain-containing protein n=1 Tax=Lactobacillus amylovorus (strain GRL 1112) TaxID=695560 RepID=F2M3T0_LACAR|nr:zinc-ribbon domain-containing protein [Lactobacillus amylovorus]AEA32930.1 hypothetical protein LA2_11004 [Lactobacillus amylovorus GRL 1112]
MRVWWICPKGHEWQRRINARVDRQSGCPKCSPTHAKTEEEWNKLLSKVGDKIIKFKTNGSDRSLIECKNGHKWEARLADVYSNIKTIVVRNVLEIENSQRLKCTTRSWKSIRGLKI